MKRFFSTKRVALTGMLAAAALALWAVESAIPTMGLLPPGVKLGLSNIMTMFAAYTLGFPAAAAIVAVKAAVSLFTRGAMAGLLSLCGGLLSAAVLCGLLRLDRKNRMGFFGISVIGALCHNAGQLAAVALLTSPAALWYGPVLTVSALMAGTVTGLLLKALYPYMRRVQDKWMGDRQKK